MKNEKIALVALVIVVMSALCVFLIAVNTTFFEDIFTEKLTIEEGDCADVNYIGRYPGNNSIFDSSYTYIENKTGGIPLKIFVTTNTSLQSPKGGYSSGMIKGFMMGIIGMKEGQTKTIGPIAPKDAYGEKKFTIGSLFNSSYLAFGMNQDVIVTNYTATNLSVKWINVENLSNFTMPQVIIKNLQSTNETEMVIYPPPCYIWENATRIINISDSSVIVKTNPTKSTNLSTQITNVRNGEQEMLIFPDATTASWTNDTITIICSPTIGKNYTTTQEFSGTTYNVVITVINITADKINVSVVNDQDPTPTYSEYYKTFTFNRTFILPRYYNNIPTMYISYVYLADIEYQGYSINPLAGESLLFEVTVEKVYKTSQEES